MSTPEQDAYLHATLDINPADYPAAPGAPPPPADEPPSTTASADPPPADPLPVDPPPPVPPPVDPPPADPLPADPPPADPVPNDPPPADPAPTDPAPADPPSPAPAADAPTGALSASDTVFYFDLDSSVLTPSDTASLDAYAAAVIAAGSDFTAIVQGYASVDGDAGHNVTLAEARAKAVAAYLTGKGVPAQQVDLGAKGKVTDEFDKTDPRENRRATLPQPPAKPPEPQRTDQKTNEQPDQKPDMSDDDAYKMGYQAGLQNDSQVCPAHVGPGGEAAYNKGYAQGQEDRPKQRMLDRIKSDMKDPRSLKEDAEELNQMTMSKLLDVLDTLDKAGLLEDFAAQVADGHPRIAGGTYTVQQNFGEAWRSIVPKLRKPDQDAIRKRTPPDLDQNPLGPAKGDEDDPKRSLQTDEGTKVESIATLSVFEGITKNKILGLEFSVHVGVDGKLTNFEQDLKLFEKQIKGRLHGIPFEVTFGLDFDNEVKFNTDDQRRVTIDKVETNLKGSAEVAAKGVKFRLEGKSDGGGVKWEVVVIEVPIP